MSIEKTLDAWHSKVTKIQILQIFTAFTRVLLFVGFTPPSIIKIVNRPFTVLPDSNPVGHYFNALYQTGFYYQFIGWAQLLAAALLLFPRTAHLGALMFFPIILNIAVLTNSVGFQGTWLITILMTLAALYLVAWDYDRLKPILFKKRSENASILKKEFLLVPLFFALGGAVASPVWGLIAFGKPGNFVTGSIVLAGLGFIFGLFVALHHRFMKVGELNKPDEFI